MYGLQGKAAGRIFLDDDHTYNYQKGEFAYREFTLDQGVLRSAAVDRSGSFKAPNRVERIVILGWKSSPSKVSSI
jgi:hypothetical protein